MGEFKDSEFLKFWYKYGNHIMAPLILIMLISIWWVYFDSVQVQKEISINCGWGEDDYKCYCEKGKAMEIKNKINNPYGNSLGNFTINDTEGG